MKVFIMGMHRSGTSLVTGLLHKCGLYLGDNLLMHAKDNPKGHFEHKRMINLNNQLLRRNGGTWFNPPIGLNYMGMKLQMKAFLASFPDGVLCGFKDPRICITFPLWYALIEEKMKVVFVYRPVEEIAASLKKRNGFPIKKSLQLISRYNQIAFSNIQGKPNVQYMVTHFHSYFQNWRVELESVLDFLEMKMPSARKNLEEFVDKDLWHNRQAK